MQENISVVITIILFVMIAVLFPLYNLFERQDDMSYVLALKVTTNFVDEVKNVGYIDQAMYDKFMIELGNTGKSYDIVLEAHRKTLIPLEGKKDEYSEEYRIDYNQDIFKQIENKTNNTNNILKQGAYLLNKDDQFYVKLKNSNETFAGMLLNSIIPVEKKDRIVVNYGGVIKTNSWSKVDSDVHGASQKPFTPTLQVTNKSTGANVSFVNSATTINLKDTLVFKASSNASDWNKKIDKYVWNVQYSNGTSKVFTTRDNTTFETKMTHNTSGVNTITVYAVDTYGEESIRVSVYVYTNYIKPTPVITCRNSQIKNGTTLELTTEGLNLTFDVSVSDPDVSEFTWYITKDASIVSATGNSYTRWCDAGSYTVKVTGKTYYGEYTNSATYTFTLKRMIYDLATVAKPGDYIRYTGHAGSYSGLWRVLYNDAKNGFQIITVGSIENYEIGSERERGYLQRYYQPKYLNTNIASEVRGPLATDITNMQQMGMGMVSASNVGEYWLDATSSKGTNTRSYEYVIKSDNLGNMSNKLVETGFYKKVGGVYELYRTTYPNPSPSAGVRLIAKILPGIRTAGGIGTADRPYELIK